LREIPGVSAITIEVDGASHDLCVRPAETLLEVLRDRLGITNIKKACGRGECGSCTVLVGGRAIMACVTLAMQVLSPVETIKGLAEETRAFREAMADLGGFQCSYCTPGMVTRTAALMRGGLPETDEELRAALAGNLCRCTGYQGIIRALRRADSQRHVA
jgi:aerobic-type carbon monoxide dehydrogenase small subunit (CoxS/CutS family)